MAATVRSDELIVRLISFGTRSLRVASALPKTDLARHVGLQMFRAASSAGANYSEACGAESKRDFVHKMQLVVKELREAHYWLRLIDASELVPSARLSQLLPEADELIAICVASAKTAKTRGVQ